MKRKVPKFASDQDAIDFLDQDLSDLDDAQFKPVSFEFSAKAAQTNMRVPRPLLTAVKVRAKARSRKGLFGQGICIPH